MLDDMAATDRTQLEAVIEKRRRRKQYGLHCKTCKVKLPKAVPPILLPGEKCRIDGYVDPRPEMSEDDYRE